MKKALALLLTVIALFCAFITPTPVSAAKNVRVYKKGKEHYSYIIQNDNTVKITAYCFVGSEEWIVSKIPSKIAGKKVTAIGQNAFERIHKNPSDDVSGNNAWFEKIIIPNTVKSIEHNAFSEAVIKSVTIPDSVTKIGAEAFFSCEELEEINIGKNVTSIGQDAFFNTGYFNNKKNWENKIKYSFFYLGNYLIYVSDICEETLKIKKGTTVVADGALFSHAFDHKLKSVECPDSLRYIGNEAFEDGCFSKIKLNNGLISIGKRAFYGSWIKSVTIPKSVKKIGEKAFDEIYYKDEKTEKCYPNKAFRIYGYRGSAAQKYAEKNNIKFSALNPAAPKITVKAGKKKLKVSWKSVKSAEGYQIKCGSKTVETKKLKKTIKLKKGTYKVKVRCYKIKNGKRVYSPWSKAQTVKVK